MCINKHSSAYLFLVNHDVAIDQYVVEQKELSGFGFLSTHFCQDSFSDQHSARDCEWLLKKGMFTSERAVAISVCSIISHLLSVYHRH